MRKKAEKLNTTERIIFEAAIRNGYRKIDEVVTLCGFSRSSFFRYRHNPGMFPMSWISTLDKQLSFSDEELVRLIRAGDEEV